MNVRSALSGIVSTIAFAAIAHGAQVTWGAAESNGVGIVDNSGTPLPLGDLVLLGHFNLTPAQIIANGANESFLMSNFVMFDSSTIGAGSPNGGGSNAGYWSKASIGSTDLLGIQNQAIDYWVFNATTSASATQYGIFTASASTNPAFASAWKFPDDIAIPSSTTTDLSDVPHDSTGIYWGSFNGTGISGDGSSPLYYLAPFSAVPEPSTWVAGALVAATLAGVARRRLRA